MAACSGFARADFSYTETTQITGGSTLAMMKMAAAFSKAAKQAGDPTVSTVSVKGNRLMRSGKDTVEIIDLDAETITTIDMAKKQYTVLTFEQMKQRMHEAMEQAKAQQQKAGAQPASNPQNQNVDVKFKVKVRNTGATKDVAGLGSTESILNMTAEATDTSTGQSGAMAITNDMWMAPEIPGYGEVREFYKRFAEKMGPIFGEGGMSPSLLASQPAAATGMADMVKEMSKLKGVPVMQVMRMGMTTNGQPLPAASEAPLPPQPDGPAMPTAKGVASAALASQLGGFGFGHKKKTEDAPPPADPSAAPPPYSVLVESNTQISSISTGSVDPAVFTVPAGFKQVQPKQ